jgi:insulin-like growth factor-binding protein complex acid labile subunit
MFYQSESIEFIPKNLKKNFPNLEGLQFYESNIPTIKADLFTDDVAFTKYLDLDDNKISNIERGAFEKLPELFWIDVRNNRLTNISFDLFEHNPKLSYINLYNNQIVMLNPSLFANLKSLKKVTLTTNKCISSDSTFESSDGTLSTMNQKLEQCYTNCADDDYCNKIMIDD